MIVVFWTLTVIGALLTYHTTGLLFMYFKVERWRERAADHTTAALNFNRRGIWYVGDSMQQTHKAYRCNAIADRNAKTVRVFWPFLREE